MKWVNELNFKTGYSDVVGFMEVTVLRFWGQNNYIGDFITSPRCRHKPPVTNVYVTSGPPQQRMVGPVLELRTI